MTRKDIQEWFCVYLACAAVSELPETRNKESGGADTGTSTGTRASTLAPPGFLYVAMNLRSSWLPASLFPPGPPYGDGPGPPPSLWVSFDGDADAHGEPVPHRPCYLLTPDLYRTIREQVRGLDGLAPEKCREVAGRWRVIEEWAAAHHWEADGGAVNDSGAGAATRQRLPDPPVTADLLGQILRSVTPSRD